MSSARIQVRITVGTCCSKRLYRSCCWGWFICPLINGLEHREKTSGVDQYLTNLIPDALTFQLDCPRTRRWQYSTRPPVHSWRVFETVSRSRHLDGLMEGDGIAEHGHHAASVTYFGINSKWIMITNVTYGTNPVISKPYIEWNSRKASAE